MVGIYGRKRGGKRWPQRSSRGRRNTVYAQVPKKQRRSNTGIAILQNTVLYDRGLRDRTVGALSPSPARSWRSARFVSSLSRGIGEKVPALTHGRRRAWEYESSVVAGKKRSHAVYSTKHQWVSPALSSDRMWMGDTSTSTYC
jgi:hypothetical protein